MKLYGFWRSTCTWRVRIALAWKEIEHQYQPIHLVKGEQLRDDYSAINPMRQVPVLEFTDGGRLVRLAQSMAILDYLDAIFPTPPLLPTAPLERARVRQLSEIITSGIQPLQNTGTQTYLREQLHADVKEWVRHWVGRGLGALEVELASTAGTFSFGDQITLVDLCLIPQLYFARRFGFEMEKFPTLSRVERACSELPAFQRAHGEAQPDYEKPQ